MENPNIKSPTFKKNFKHMEEETNFSGHYAKSVLETLYFSIKPYLGKISFLIILGFFARGVMLFISNVVGYWADSLCQGKTLCKEVPVLFQNFQTKEFVILLCVLSGSGFFLNSFFRILLARTGTRSISNLYKEVTLRTSRLPMRFFDTNPVGRMVTRFTVDFAGVFRMAGGPFTEFLSLVIDLLLMTIFISLAAPYYILLVVITILLNYSVYKYNQKKLRNERRSLSRARGPAIAHFSETVQGGSIIKTYGREGIFENRFSLLLDHMLQQKLKTLFGYQIFSLQMVSVTSLLTFFTGGFCLFLLTFKLVSLGSVGVAFTFVMMLSTTVQMLFDWLSNMEDALTGVERLDEYLRKDISKGERLPASANFSTLHPQFSIEEEKELLSSEIFNAPNASLEIKDLHFRYSFDLPLVLKGLNLFIAPGEHVGIIGRTGSGKSSLIQALYHLYPLEKGVIEIQGLEAELNPISHSKKILHKDSASLLLNKKIPLELFRQSMSIITQGPILFRSTLKENLLGPQIFHPYSDKDLYEILSLVGLDGWIGSLGKDALNFQIAEGGKNLSAGQRQLISLARCLLKKSPIVIMDEATSDVDPQTENFIIEAAQKYLREKTQIVVAHRISTIEACDRVVWIHEGKVVAEGQPKEILKDFRKFEYQKEGLIR